MRAAASALTVVPIPTACWRRLPPPKRMRTVPQILAASGQEPAFAGLPDLNLSLSTTSVLDGRLVLLDYVPRPPGNR